MAQHHLDNYNHAILVRKVFVAISTITPLAIHGVKLAVVA